MIEVFRVRLGSDIREGPISDENKEQIRLDNNKTVQSDIVQTWEGKYGADVFGLFTFSQNFFPESF